MQHIIVLVDVLVGWGKVLSNQPNRKINIDAALVCIGATVASPIGRLK
jgi:hypothetical protein